MLKQKNYSNKQRLYVMQIFELTWQSFEITYDTNTLTEKSQFTSKLLTQTGIVLCGSRTNVV